VRQVAKIQEMHTELFWRNPSK